jgi:hypothetical protein
LRILCGKKLTAKNTQSFRKETQRLTFNSKITMMIKKLLPSALLLCIYVSAISQVKKSAGNVKAPNILVIISDDHALSTIGAYGSTYGLTPNIDRIANKEPRLPMHLLLIQFVRRAVL